MPAAGGHHGNDRMVLALLPDIVWDTTRNCGFFDGRIHRKSNFRRNFGLKKAIGKRSVGKAVNCVAVESSTDVVGKPDGISDSFPKGF
ncbi:hypothetical protein CRG98_023077 [Punica granatum]|uniref:Uncharacterized protein n=1 Tax=Punica granatum TaxID=22663 RepID=A0A2I0JJU6_PUNGR|nr:hypothetical protein CRG98_023077 [Punica granatum]